METHRSIEWKEHSAAKTAVRSIESVQVHCLAVDVRGKPGDAPAVPSSADQVSWLKP